MKRLILLALLMSGAAYAATISSYPTTAPLTTDKIPIGRSAGGTSYAVTAGSLSKASFPAKFSNISSTGMYVPQTATEQSVQMFEALGNGTNFITLKPMANMSSSRTFVYGNHGLYVDGVKVLSW